MGTQNEIKEGEKIVNNLALKVTLKMFRAGCDEKNFIILQSFPLTAKNVEKELGFKAPMANKRIKELMESKLAFREKAGEEIKLTSLGKDFLDYINSLKEDVIKNMAELI